VLNSQLCRRLRTEATGLDLEEISHKVWGGREVNTHMNGLVLIDDVWASRSLEIGGFLILPFSQSIGDHRSMLFDVSSRSLLGVFEHNVVRAECRRLNTQTSSLGRYNAILERLMATHRLIERQDAVISEIMDNKPTPKQRQQMETLDRQFVEFQKCAERRCRKIIKPELEFSPQVKLWQERMWAFKALIRWRKGLACNQTNVLRTAGRRLCRKFPNPRDMTLEEMEAGYEYCKGRKRLLRGTAPELRREHMHTRMMDAKAKKDKERVKAIKQKMARESGGKMWYFIALKVPW